MKHNFQQLNFKGYFFKKIIFKKILLVPYFLSTPGLSSLDWWAVISAKKILFQINKLQGTFWEQYLNKSLLSPSDYERPLPFAFSP
jgi:hypothetical protein